MNRFAKMERQILVRPVWLIKVDHLQRCSRKFRSDRTETDLSIRFPANLSRIFGIMRSTRQLSSDLPIKV